MNRRDAMVAAAIAGIGLVSGTTAQTAQLDTAKAYVTGIFSGDLASTENLVVADYEPGDGRSPGIDALNTRLQSFRDGIIRLVPDASFRIDGGIENGNIAVVLASLTGNSTQGTAIDVVSLFWFEMQGGLIRRIYSTFDRQELSEQIYG